MVCAMNTFSRFYKGLAGPLAIALLATGCGSSGSGTTTTTSTTAPTATTQPAVTTTTPTTQVTTTTAAPTTMAPTTTTAAPTTTTTTTTTVATTTTVDVNALADGSGCTPGGDELGNGIWFGYISEARDTEIDFDLACWFTGDAAAMAAAEDGEESPPPNDYYVRNVNPHLRTIPVAASAEVSWLPNPGDPTTQERLSYADWMTASEGRDAAMAPGVWVTIENGAATVIEEQFVP
jgi:hypothetical protein